ncbi:MAG: hypothetical protein NTY30_01615 [Candidatus Berkelbacteria bacterium]|nr:hypothetical protein [Candidatus Berkelbacteria bacterium]
MESKEIKPNDSYSSLAYIFTFVKPFARMMAQTRKNTCEGCGYMPCAAHSQAQQERESRAKRNIVLIAIGVSAAILAAYAICCTFFGHTPSFFERMMWHIW